MKEDKHINSQNNYKTEDKEKDSRTKLGEYLLSFEEIYKIKLSSAVFQNQRLYYFRGIFVFIFRKRHF